MPNWSRRPPPRITLLRVLGGVVVVWLSFELGALIWWAFYGFGLTELLLMSLLCAVFALGAMAWALLLEWRSRRRKTHRYLGG